MARDILVAVARVAGQNLSELARQFSPLAKTTQVELEILTWVARADIVLCYAGHYLKYALPALAVLWAVILCRGR